MYKVQTLLQRTLRTPIQRSSIELNALYGILDFVSPAGRPPSRISWDSSFDYFLGKDRAMHRTNASAARRNQKRAPKRRKRGPVTNEQPGTSAGGCGSRWKLSSKVGCIALSLTAVHACKNRQGILAVCFLQLRFHASEFAF